MTGRHRLGHSIVNPIIQTIRSLGPVRLAAMGAVTVGLIAFFLYLTTRLTTPSMALLYGELSMDDSGRIVSRLEGMNVPFELAGDGSRILVPADQKLRLRMAMASEGLPTGGSVGYEIFDKSDLLGTTNFVQRLNHVRALEGELARTIASLAQVQSARVHLVMPQRELFSRVRQEPSASIAIRVRGSSPQPSQVQAIQHLVAAAVPGLKPGRVSVIDDSGTLLARGDETEDGAVARNAEATQRHYEQRLAESVEALLEQSIGMGKVRAEISLEMDFDRVTTREERFDPDGQVVRSIVTEEEAEVTAEINAGNAVTVANNIPNNPANANAAQNNSRSTITRETVNYEVSTLLETHVRETGAINRMSVAVLVDGIYDADGNYQPRGDEEMEQIKALVRSAVGYREERGDVVEVINLQFMAPTDLPEPQVELNILGFGKEDLFRLAEMVVLGVVALLVILLVVRPLISRAFESIPAAASGETADNLLADHSGATAVPQIAADTPGAAAAVEMPGRQQNDELEEMINLSSVEGRVAASSIKRISEIVEKHPDETVSIMRNWIFQSS